LRRFFGGFPAHELPVCSAFWSACSGFHAFSGLLDGLKGSILLCKLVKKVFLSTHYHLQTPVTAAA
jgi:hypothetical protein